MSNSRSNYPSNDIPRRVCFVFIKTLKDKRVCTKAHFGEVTIIITYLLIIMAKSTELRQYLRHRYANILYFL